MITMMPAPAGAEPDAVTLQMCFVKSVFRV